MGLRTCSSLQGLLLQLVRAWALARRKVLPWQHGTGFLGMGH